MFYIKIPIGYKNYDLLRRGLNVKKSSELLCNLFHSSADMNRKK
jgi:hypothetical protein